MTTKKRKAGKGTLKPLVRLGWFEEYDCGCTSETEKRKSDLLGYCGTHGGDRKNIYPDIMPNAGLSIPGGEPGYAPGDCSAFKVRDLTGKVPERLCKTREAAESWVHLVTEGNPSARLIIEQNNSGEGRPHAAGKDDGHGQQA